MSKTKSENSAGPVVLRVNTIADGKFYMAGTETPFTEATLPEHLRPDIATGDEDFYSHSERLIYHQPGQPGGPIVFQQTGGGSQWRQARQVAAGLEQQVWAEEQAEAAGKLPPETEEALQAAHDKASALAKAQIAYNQRAADIAYEQAQAASESPQLFVKRGGEMGRIERSKLKVGEAVYAKFDQGDWQVVGYVDATGQAPPPPLIP